MDMSVDETRAHGAIGEIEDLSVGRAADRSVDLRYAIVLDENLGGTGQRLGNPIEHVATNQNNSRHAALLSWRSKITAAAKRRLSTRARSRRSPKIEKRHCHAAH